MNANRLWLIGTFVLIVVMLAGTFLIGVSPQLSAAAIAATEKADVEAQNVGHEQTLARLKEQYSEIDSLRTDLDALRKELPADPEQAALLNEIGDLAVANSVVVDNINLDLPEPYVAGDSVDREVAAATPSVSAGNFFVVPLQMRVIGTSANALAFVKQLQNGTRLILVYELNVSGSEGGSVTGDVVLSISGQAFVLNNAVAVAPAAPVEGAATPN
jgi:Tfp pilus assembly protein PilO